MGTLLGEHDHALRMQRDRVVDHEGALDRARDGPEDDIDPVGLQERDAVGTADLDDLQLHLHLAGDLAGDVRVEPVDLVLRIEDAERHQRRIDAGAQLPG
jgi:hypothetical protein